MAPLLPGDLVGGRFRIIRRLGAGGFGEVYLAEDETIARHVAIKRLKSDVSGDIALREARAAGRLVHPNVVTIYDVGTIDGDVFLAMEYVDGSSLDHFMAPQALSLHDRLTLLIQLCRGLSAAHQAMVIHRDIKPRNLIVDRKLTLKIVDFGIARAGGASTIVAPGMIAGSVEYMAPEQLAGHEIDHRIDIFAASVVAYELLSGERAFPGGLTTAFRRTQTTHVPALPATVGEIGPSLDVVLRKGLARDRNLRFESADALADAFEALRSQSDSDATLRVGSAPDTRIRSGNFNAAVPAFLTPASVRESTAVAAPVSATIRPESAGRQRAIMIGLATVIVAALMGMPTLLRDRPTDSGSPAAGASNAASKAEPAEVVPAPSSKKDSRASRSLPSSRRGGDGGEPVSPSTTASLNPAVDERSPDSRAPETNAAPPSGDSGPLAEGPPPNVDPAPAVQPGRPQDPAIMAVVQAYANAHQNKSAATIKTLQPSLSSGQMAALDRGFAENDEYDFRVSAASIAMNGNRARVTCTVTRVLSLNGERRVVTRPAVFDLELTDGGSWLVAAYRVSP